MSGQITDCQMENMRKNDISQPTLSACFFIQYSLNLNLLSLLHKKKHVGRVDMLVTAHV